MNKVGPIRNDVIFGSGTFTRSQKVFQDAMGAIGIAEMAVRSAEAEERRRRRKREAAAAC